MGTFGNKNSFTDVFLYNRKDKKNWSQDVAGCCRFYVRSSQTELPYSAFRRISRRRWPYRLTWSTWSTTGRGSRSLRWRTPWITRPGPPWPASAYSSCSMTGRAGGSPSQWWTLHHQPPTTPTPLVQQRKGRRTIRDSSPTLWWSPVRSFPTIQRRFILYSYSIR